MGVLKKDSWSSQWFRILKPSSWTVHLCSLFIHSLYFKLWKDTEFFKINSWSHALENMKWDVHKVYSNVSITGPTCWYSIIWPDPIYSVLSQCDLAQTWNGTMNSTWDWKKVIEKILVRYIRLFSIISITLKLCLILEN